MGAPRKHPQKDAAEVIERLATEGRAIIGIAKHLGVSRETFKAWCERDESLQEAFECGRDAHRQALVALIMRDAAVSGRSANSNAMFLLKTMHGFRENDTPNTKVDVGVNIAQNVLVVHSHGSDAEWEAKAVEHQRALVANAANPPKQIEATIASPAYVPSVEAVPAWIPAHLAKATPQTSEAPAWRSNA